MEQVVVKKITVPRVLLAVLLIGVYTGTLMPGSIKAEIEGHFWSALPWSAMAHFVLFCAMAALPAYGRGQAALGGAMLLALLVAASTELLQHFVPGRHPLLRDALIDLAGALTGCALQLRLRSLRRFAPVR